MAATGKFGRVEHDEVKLCFRGDEVIEVVEDIGLFEDRVYNAIAFRVLPGEDKSVFGAVDAEDRFRARFGGVEAKTARIAKRVEHAPSLGETGDNQAIVALVEVEAG